MGKFGKKNIVSSDMSNYMIGIIGPSGFGKSTLMYKTCEKLFGDEGYISFTEDTEPNFLSEDLTIAEYMNGEFEQSDSHELTAGGMQL